MNKKYPYHKGELQNIIKINENGLSYNVELSFVIDQNEKSNIKKYLDFRNKLDKLDLYFVDTNSGSRTRKQYRYIYIWTMCEEDINFRDNYYDYVTFLKLTFPQYST